MPTGGLRLRYNNMKKIFTLLFILSCFIMPVAAVFAQSNDGLSKNNGTSLQYEMTSYVANNKDASTPFFNLAFFNQRYFTINFQSFGNAFQFLFDLMIGISIATAVIVFMISAFNQIVNGKSVRLGSFGEIKGGNEGMYNAIIGLIIVLSTWLILNTINPDLIRLPIFTSLDQLGSQQQVNQQASPIDVGSPTGAQ